MELQEVFYLEIEGISKTICEYSVDNFISSYSKQITELDFKQDIRKITIIVARLCEWYEKNIEDIKKSQFVVNKEEHTKSMLILKELQIKIKKQYKGNYGRANIYCL